MRIDEVDSTSQNPALLSATLLLVTSWRLDLGLSRTSSPITTTRTPAAAANQGHCSKIASQVIVIAIPQLCQLKGECPSKSVSVWRLPLSSSRSVLRRTINKAQERNTDPLIARLVLQHT